MRTSEFYENINRNDIENIVRKHPTPAYIYFTEIINKRFDDLKNTLPPAFQIHYALKANPNTEVLEHLHKLGAGADVASMGELKAALKCGVPKNCIEFSGPGKVAREIEYALSIGISSINAESLSELNKILTISRSTGKVAKVGIRINPNPEGLKAGMSMSGETQFGLHDHDLKKSLEFIKANSRHLQFTGLHIHSGSQLLSAESIIDNFRYILDLTLEIENYNILKINKINFGGGWGINYYPGQKKLDLQKISEGLNRIFESAKYKQIIEQASLIVEPGRFLVGECGIYATKVLYTKKARTKNFAIVDGGMHQHYLLVGGLGQVIKRNFEMDCFCKGKENPDETFKYDIAGCLCTPQDILAVNFECDHKIKADDYIIFFNSGAYAFSASPLLFLSHSPPAEVIL